MALSCPGVSYTNYKGGFVLGGRGSSSGMNGGSVQDKIANMPSFPYADPGDVRNLTPMAPEQEINEASRLYATARKNGELSYTEKKVSASDLTTRQEWVTHNKLQSMNEGIPGRISGLPTSTDPGVRAISYNGKLILVDGNHRVNLALLRGQKRMTIRVFEANR